MMQTGAGFSGEGLCSYQTLPGTEVSTNKHLQIWIQSLVLSKEESNFYPKKDLPWPLACFVEGLSFPVSLQGCDRHHELQTFERAEGGTLLESEIFKKHSKIEQIICGPFRSGTGLLTEAGHSSGILIWHSGHIAWYANFQRCQIQKNKKWWFFFSLKSLSLQCFWYTGHVSPLQEQYFKSLSFLSSGICYSSSEMLFLFLSSWKEWQNSFT